MGRPSSFSQEIADEICERLREGESLRAICENDHMPSKSTVLLWVQKDEQGFSDQYTRARELQGETYADRAVHEALTASDAGIGRLRMDALKWAAGKLAPKKYGDKTLVGSDPENPLPAGFTVNLVKSEAG